MINVPLELNTLWFKWLLQDPVLPVLHPKQSASAAVRSDPKQDTGGLRTPLQTSSSVWTQLLVCKLLELSHRGMVAPDYNPDGSCATGYQGILCASCQPGYSITGSFTCSLCPNETANVIRLSGILIAAIIIVVFMIRSTLNGALEVRNVTSIYQKIILNHIQLIVLTASFNFNWPEMVTSFFNASQPVG